MQIKKNQPYPHAYAHANQKLNSLNRKTKKECY